MKLAPDPQNGLVCCILEAFPDSTDVARHRRFSVTREGEERLPPVGHKTVCQAVLARRITSKNVLRYFSACNGHNIVRWKFCTVKEEASANARVSTLLVTSSYRNRESLCCGKGLRQSL